MAKAETRGDSSRRASPLRFRDRGEAGRLLAERLGHLAPTHALVLALPRGGVGVAEPIADALGAELDVFVSRKIGAPGRPELALGAVAEGDVVIWNEDVVVGMGAGAAARARAEQVARTELAERVAAFRAVAPRVSPSGRTVIVVDDGVATGATLKAALRAIASLGPARLVVALPGGPADTLSEIGEMPGVDELVVLTVPRDFYAVGQLYDRFEQVATQAVCDALERNRSRARSLPAGGRAESSRSGEAPR